MRIKEKGSHLILSSAAPCGFWFGCSDCDHVLPRRRLLSKFGPIADLVFAVLSCRSSRQATNPNRRGRIHRQPKGQTLDARKSGQDCDDAHNVRDFLREQRDAPRDVTTRVHFAAP